MEVFQKVKSYRGEGIAGNLNLDKLLTHRH